MSFDPKAFQDFALDLQKACKKESEYRTIINRSYYAAFGTGRTLAGIMADGASVHQETYTKLQNINHESAQKAGKLLQNMFKKRKQADYSYNTEIKEFESEQAVKDAAKFFAYLKEYNAFENREEDFDDD